MSRVINTNRPGKLRHYHMRSGAELLRHLSQKPEIDDETLDMLAALYFSLIGIQETLDTAIEAWEKRDYWIKAEHFREKWLWVSNHSTALGRLLNAQDWSQLPILMAKLFPNYAEISINKFTRSSELWEGEHQRFLEEYDG